MAIIGESGSGKSTLALALTHLIKYQGEIVFYNQKWQQNLKSKHATFNTLSSKIQNMNEFELKRFLNQDDLTKSSCLQILKENQEWHHSFWLKNNAQFEQEMKPFMNESKDSNALSEFYREYLNFY